MALLYSCGVRPDATHNALRGQKVASSEGWRPGVLEEPEPPEHAGFLAGCADAVVL